MGIVEATQINSFGPMPKADESPSDDPIFVLTSSQLRSLMVEAVGKAIQPLQDRIESLESIVASQGDKLSIVKDRVVDVEVEQDFIRSDLMKIANQINQRATTAAAGKTAAKRTAEIDKILKASPNGAAPFKLIRDKLGLAPNQFSRLISSLDKRKYQVTPHPSRPKEKILRAKVRWS